VTPEPSAVAAVLDVLRRSGAALTASEIKQALEADGLDRLAADRVWSRAQKRVRAHEHVTVDAAHRYGWVEETAELSPAQALEKLGDGGLSARRRAELVDAVRGAL
jgi:hypothetical protein